MDQPIGVGQGGRPGCSDDWALAIREIVAAGRRLDSRGWVPATAGNISRRLPDGRIAITRSGGHKGFLTEDGVIEVDLDGRPVVPGDRPSAETLLHCQIYRHLLPSGAVLHGHSVAATVLSMHTAASSLTLSGYELLKVFDGQHTHDTTLRLPIVDNDQDIARLCRVVGPQLAGCRLGYLIRGHGVYVWAPTMELAMARLEALEFLLACMLERGRLEPMTMSPQ